MSETIERAQQAVRQRRMDNLGIASIPTSFGLGMEGLRRHAALEAYSTTPSRGLEDFQVIILDEHDSELMLSGSPFSRNWSWARPPEQRAMTTQSAEIVKPSNVIDDIQWLRSALNLSMSEVAALFKVTRKAVYDWLDGSKPRTGLAERIATMRALFERNLPSESRSVVRQFFDTPIDGETTLLSILRDVDTTNLTAKGVNGLNAIAHQVEKFAAELNSKPAPHGIGHAHNDDLYRSA